MLFFGPLAGLTALGYKRAPSFEQWSNRRADSAWHRPVREKTSQHGYFLAPWPS